MLERNKQSNKDKSINNQGNGSQNVTIQNNTTNIILTVSQLVDELKKSVFNGLPSNTLQEINCNAGSYIRELESAINNLMRSSLKDSNRIDDLEKILYSPDFQYIHKNALIAASRSNSNEFHKHLAFLLANRLCKSDNEFIRILYNQSIDIIYNLTKDQIKYLTFLFISNVLMISADETNNLIYKMQEYYLNIINFNVTNADLRHLTHAGCIKTDVLSYNYLDNFNKRYPVLINSTDQMVLNIKTKLDLAVIKKAQINPLGVIIAYANYSIITSTPIEELHDHFLTIWD